MQVYLAEAEQRHEKSRWKMKRTQEVEEILMLLDEVIKYADERGQIIARIMFQDFKELILNKIEVKG